jgi:hypothetical protein
MKYVCSKTKRGLKKGTVFNVDSPEEAACIFRRRRDVVKVWGKPPKSGFMTVYVRCGNNKEIKFKVDSWYEHLYEAVAEGIRYSRCFAIGGVE